MKKLIFSASFMLFFGFVFGQKKEAIPLYTSGVPNSKAIPANYQESKNPGWIERVSNPTLTPYLPTNPNGTAVIVLPGGGYAALAATHEGESVALELNKIGVTAFVLKYRLPSDSIMVDKKIGPLQDAQRAIQLLRENAAQWHINPSRIGIMGFSAGGHLASTAITHFDRPVIANPANTSLRPDFGVLIYPVISMDKKLTHAGTRDSLLGKKPSGKWVKYYSNELQVTANTPPTFLMHAEDDAVVPVQNSLMFYEALLKAGVKAEMHLYQAGGHGFGLVNSSTKAKWFDNLAAWMAANGWLAQ